MVIRAHCMGKQDLQVAVIRDTEVDGSGVKLIFKYHTGSGDATSSFSQTDHSVRRRSWMPHHVASVYILQIGHRNHMVPDQFHWFCTPSCDLLCPGHTLITRLVGARSWSHARTSDEGGHSGTSTLNSSSKLIQGIT